MSFFGKELENVTVEVGSDCTAGSLQSGPPGEAETRWLLMTHERAKHDDFPITQEFLSEMLGTPRSEVSAATGALRRSGIIQYERRKMTILDREGIRNGCL
jgi:CRP-like cAMP-binding protein